MAIKLFYTIFLALLIALFVGFGIDTFYSSPEPPEYPSRLEVLKPDNTMSDEDRTAFEEYDQAQKQYQEKSKIYNRNVSIIALVAAIIILILSLTFLSKIKMIADGILLGGILTTAYGIIRGLMSDSSRFRFFVIAIGLLIAVVLGYIKFIRPKENSGKK